MSKFILKTTDDGMVHLYFDSPHFDGFQKIGQAQKVYYIRDHPCYYVILFNEAEDTQTLFGVVGEAYYKVSIPKTSNISFVDNICFYDREPAKWHTMVLNSQGVFEEMSFGTMNIMHFNCSQIIKYKTSYWTYFVKEENGFKELYHFINGQPIKLGGKYIKVCSDRNEFVFGVCANGRVDVFTVNSTSPLKPELNAGFECCMSDGSEGILLPNLDCGKWDFYPGFSLLGKNAAYKIIETYGKRKMEVYRINGCELKLVDTSKKFRFKGRPHRLVTENMVYLINSREEFVDFDNAKPTFKKRIKDFFHLK